MPASKTASKKSSRRSQSREDLSISFEFERSTKNTHRFAEVAEEGEAVIGTLYIQKSAIGEEPPESITVTISAE